MITASTIAPSSKPLKTRGIGLGPIIDDQARAPQIATGVEADRVS